MDSVDIFERINVYDVLASFLFLGLVKSFSFFLSFPVFDEVQDLSPSDVWEKSLELFLLLTNALIIAIFSLEILQKALEQLNELFLLTSLTVKILQLSSILVLIRSGLLAVVKHDDESDDHKFLLKHSDIVEKL